MVEKAANLFDQGLQCGAEANMAKQGWRAGGKAILGYQLEKQVVGSRDGQPLTKSKLKPDPKTFHEVQKYLKGRARGESRRELQAHLSIKVPYSTLVYIEDSAMTYAGHTVWNRHREFIDGAYVGPGTGRYRDQSEWEIHRDTHEAMITDEEANAIFRERDKQKRKTTRFRRNHYLLSSKVRCSCGARIDGDGGFYRCHDRCGVRGIKKETLERAMLDWLHTGLFSKEHLAEIQAETAKLLSERVPRQTHLASQLKREIREIERQSSDLASMLSEVKHRRPLIQRIDALEDEREALELRLSDLEEIEEPEFCSYSETEMMAFAAEWRSNLEGGTMDKRKAVIRQLIESATFDGEELRLVPNLATLTGVKMASPRGSGLNSAEFLHGAVRLDDGCIDRCLGT